MLLVGEPYLGAEEKAALLDVIDSNWITMGSRVRAFEAAFAAAHGLPDAVAVSSCTAGLHLILAAHGIGPGDEVLVPSLSFVATANACLYVGAKPVFVDIDSLVMPLISVADAEAKLTSRTRAVIVMHYGGYVVPREAWRDLATRHRLLLIEDAAHAAGADQVATVGDCAVFSFYGNKNMTTAEGGMVCAADADVLRKVRHLRGHGMTASAVERMGSRTPHYDVTELGWNYRMDELRAAIGLVQLRRLAEWNALRRELTGVYHAALRTLGPDFLVPFEQDKSGSSCHFLPIVLPGGICRDEVMTHLHRRNVQTTIHYPPIHGMTYYKYRFGDVKLPATEQFAARELTLPLHPKMRASDVHRVVAILSDAVGAFTTRIAS
jgi:dTDP-4-amino-4,6-dideoxygalactose transaminase